VSTTVSEPDVPKRAPRVYVPAVGPKNRKLLLVVFALVALLGANSGYLLSITALEQFTGHTYQNYFSLCMFLGHLVLGLLLIVPFVVFGVVHLWYARGRRNRRAVRIGYALFAVSLVLLITGVLLIRVGGFDLKQPFLRRTVYWLHVGAPLAAGWLYWLHRLAGPRIKWRIGMAYGVSVAVLVGAMVALHSQDPRKWNIVGPVEGTKYFEPSLARTASGNFIPAKTLMMDDYCQKCHPDVHARWSDSVHRFSSFNNPPYLASVSETRDMAMKRDGNLKASRWCAGCHDPVPFFSGAFDNPHFDVVKDPTAHAGITCTVCHAITHVNSSRGNADFTIEEPQHYPFATSENHVLQWVNQQLVKAKPSLHKQTFLKPLHKSAEFCSTCHKVHLPFELNHYKAFLRGQNHYDSFLLSGLGHGARSFYYPPTAEENCNRCHMPLAASGDFGAKDFDNSGGLKVHDHLFPAANTGVAWLRNREEIVKAHSEFLQGKLRVDIFGIKEGGAISGTLHAPLRPNVPALQPGSDYLLETVVRTLKLGHHFTQGTVDSNEVWLDVTVTSGGKIIGRSGAIDEAGQNQVDPWSHFMNVFMLDRDGNRINRRNPQDIFVPLYNHQIPPGSGQTVHYKLQIPPGVTQPITVDVKLKYRKFDSEYMEIVNQTLERLGTKLRGRQSGQPYDNELPIVTLASDSMTFPVVGMEGEVSNKTPEIPEWQRWNDYGIGMFLTGKAELRQAAHAFEQVEKLGRFDGPLNLARVLEREGRLDEAVAALGRADAFSKEQDFPRWTWAWLSGVVDRQQGRLEEAQRNFQSVLTDSTPEMQKRGFDFSKDYVVINQLGATLFDRGKALLRQEQPDGARQFLQAAVEQFHRTLEIDSEDVTAHFSLQQLYALLGDEAQSAHHAELHERFKPDDTARGRAVRLAREKYPAANSAAEDLIIYSLNRAGAPGPNP